MTENLIPAARQDYINKYAKENNIVKVSKLSDLLGVSEITIRRDLIELERKGLIERAHGGAVYARDKSFEPSYDEKKRTSLKAKEIIGKEAANFIHNGETILITPGSTTAKVVEFIETKGVRIITTNVSVVTEAYKPNIEYLLIGGIYRAQSNSLVGVRAFNSLNGIFASKGFIGVDGFSLEYGLTTYCSEEAEITKTMISRIKGPKIVVACNEKIGCVSNFTIADISEIDYLITDSDLNKDYLNEIASVGVKIIIPSK